MKNLSKNFQKISTYFEVGLVLFLKKFNMTKKKTQQTSLTCISLTHKNTSFTALIDTGSNCCILSKAVIDKLGLTDQIIPSRRQVRSFTGEVTEFLGHIYLIFRIGSKHFRHKFQVQSELQTHTDALLGTDFFSSAGVTIHYGLEGHEMYILGKRVPVVEQE